MPKIYYFMSKMLLNIVVDGKFNKINVLLYITFCVKTVTHYIKSGTDFVSTITKD